MRAITVTHHEKNLREMRCVVSHTTPVTLHHCKGGSMTVIFGAQPGISQKVNPFFQIPLAAKYHIGEFGIDTGMGKFKTKREWEEQFGTQLDFLHEVNADLVYDIWIQAGMWIATHETN